MSNSFPSISGDSSMDSALCNYILYGLHPGGFLSRLIQQEDAMDYAHPLLKDNIYIVEHLEKCINMIMPDYMRNVSSWSGILDRYHGVEEYSDFLMTQYGNPYIRYEYTRALRLALMERTLFLLNIDHHRLLNTMVMYSDRVSGIEVRINT